MKHRSGLVALVLVCCACSEKARVERRNRELAEAARDARRPAPNDMRWIPGGEFRMGSEHPNEGPVKSPFPRSGWIHTS